jgi:Ca-activated chloride channel family protein
MIRFDTVAFLWLLLLIPVWAFGIWYFMRKRRKASEAFVGRSLFDRVANTYSSGRLRAKSILWLIAWGLLVIGAADPQVGTKLEEVKREGIDIVIAVDLSSSMLCEDITPSRLENAKHEIVRFVNGLKGDRVGLVAFAGSAIIHCPLTTDYGAVKLLVRVMSPDLLPEPGTAISDAIDAARKAFNTPEVKSKVLVIVTDGEDHEEAAIDAANDAAKDGIRIYTIGMGTPKGAPITLKGAKGEDTGVKRDKQGEVVVTRLNEILLEKIADAGEGRYFRGTQSGQELDAIWKDISSMEKKEYGKKQFTAFEDRFQYLVFPALLLLLGEFFLSERKGSMWLKRIFRNRLKRNKVSGLQ